MKVTKAVIPAAGFGTRMLPATKAMPKGMLPIVDIPAIHYIVQEAVDSGITDILIITGRGNNIVEDYFDYAPELEQALKSAGKQELYAQMRSIAEMANVQFLRQKETRGLGHAVLQAKAFVGNMAFAVLYADDIIIGHDPACGQLCRAYEQTGLGVVGIKQVPTAQISRYSSMKVEPMGQNWHTITDMVEKPPQGQEFSNYSILGRCVLPPEIFAILESTQPGAGGEIQLTDAMKTMARTSHMVGVDFTGTRYDMGNKLGFMQANVEQALLHPEIGEDFRAYLVELANNLRN